MKLLGAAAAVLLLCAPETAHAQDVVIVRCKPVGNMQHRLPISTESTSKGTNPDRSIIVIPSSIVVMPARHTEVSHVEDHKRHATWRRVTQIMALPHHVLEVRNAFREHHEENKWERVASFLALPHTILEIVDLIRDK